jgi:hypothetical protein
MNREIMFRGLSTESGEWVYGLLINEGRKIQCPVAKAKYPPIRLERLECAVDPATVGQFTELQDSKGVDIYEGDLIYIAGFGEYEVVFPFIDVYEAACEKDVGAIIGNIHEK